MNDKEFEQSLQEIAIPEVRMEQHKEMTKKEFTTMQNTPLIGVVILTIIAVGAERLRFFVDLPSLQFTLLIPLLLIFYSYKWQGVAMVFTAPFQLNASGEKKERYVAIFKDLKTYFIVSGWLGSILAFILMANTGKVFEMDMPALLHELGIAFMTILYGYFFAYFFAYPVQRGIENNHF